MQIMTHWPVPAELSIPRTVQEALRQQLIEPFDDEAAAQAFWQECSSALITLDRKESIDDLPQEAREQTLFCLTYPEFEEELPEGYKLILAIFSDDGAGIYLLLPPEFNYDIEGE